MKIMCLLPFVLSATWVLAEQVPIGVSAACSKTVSFAVAEGGQPVPAIPKFVTKWMGAAKHLEGYPEVCLSQTPSSLTTNYVVIFSIRESSFDGLNPTAHTYTSTGPTTSNTAATNSYGGTWSYSYSGGPPASATSSVDLQRVDSSKRELVLRGYDQQGRQVFHYNVNSGANREKLLDQGLADIHRDTVVAPSQKRIAAPLSVYYVNCDVDSTAPVSPVVSAGPIISPSAPKPTSQPPAILEFVSSPIGADIYLDGDYVGKTPLKLTVAPGEHALVMRKQDYGTWQQKLQASAGSRRVAGYLERKIVSLP